MSGSSLNSSYSEYYNGLFAVFNYAAQRLGALYWSAAPWHALPHTSLRLISSFPLALSPGVISSLRPLTATLFKISGPYTALPCLPLLPDFLTEDIVQVIYVASGKAPFH